MSAHAADCLFIALAFLAAGHVPEGRPNAVAFRIAFFIIATIVAVIGLVLVVNGN